MSVSWPFSAPAEMLNTKVNIEAELMLEGMSLEQKVGQMIQPDIRYITPAELSKYHIGTVLSGGGAPPNENVYADTAEWLRMADEFYDASLKSGAPLPCAWGIDAVHGHNNLFCATLFPHNIGIGATRNPELARKIAEATAIEVAATGLDWTFAPALAVTMDDRWGRTYESYSESVDLVREFTAPVIEGLQGKLSDEDFLTGPHIWATAKHYLGDGGTHGGVDQGDTLCDEVTLRDVHGVAYGDAIKAGVQVVMASFSSWQGNKMHGHHYLLQEVLKDKMGFDGFIISDWNGHGQLSASSNVSGTEAVNAGIDMLMAPEDWRGLWHNTISSVVDGAISMSRIDDAVLRILRVKLRAGLRFPNKPSDRPIAGKSELVGSAAHRAIARQAVRESAVLLKNNASSLPLKPNAKLLVTGSGADNISMQAGGWSLTWQGDGVGNDDFPGATSVFQAIQGALADGNGHAEMSENVDNVTAYDAVVVVFGEQPYAEGYGDRTHLSYSSISPKDLETLKKVSGKVPVISVFLTGRPLWVNPEINASDAFVVGWLPGSEADGLVDLLFARDGADFTGKLPFSWPREPMQSPLNFGDAEYCPLYPFGYGLSLKDSETFASDLSEEDPTQVTVPEGQLSVFTSRPTPPFEMYIGDEAGWHVAVGGNNTRTENGVVGVQTIDWQRQEDARQIRWNGGPGQLFFLSERDVDCSKVMTPGAVLQVSLCIHQAPQGRVVFRQDCVYPTGHQLDVTSLLSDLTIGTWQTLSIPLSEFVRLENASKKLTTPFLLWTDDEFELSLGEITIVGGSDQFAA